MEYFDSKVLESFMIPEDRIVTEGFGSTIIEIGKKVINFFNYNGYKIYFYSWKFN